MRFSIVLGTRPEMVKMSPVVRELQRRGEEFDLVHTGQHYSFEMDRVFFRDLDLPQPAVNLEVGSGTHGAQTGRMLIGLERTFQACRPDIVLVQGDTNTVLAGALAAAKMGIAVGHVEAGLRSFDRSMPEEVNRVLADHASDLLFAPTEVSARNLRVEGLPPERIFVTGNTIVDAVRQNLRLAMDRENALRALGLSKGRYALATLHRQENVDSPERLASIVHGLEATALRTGLDIIWPMHPRARKGLEAFGIGLPRGIRGVPPLGFLEFLRLESEAALVLTDSGGVQEECCIMGVPCVTLRDSTERPETVDVGANVVVGTEAARIVEGAMVMLARKGGGSCPLGEEGVAQRIIDICRDWRSKRG
ncbi:MAG TPA: UDP-N-acetylglucosamine 2-epimerase (non-hydrolyzing) [Methanomassiliicoccales archaeon]|nr:UDP-N-acetylglucosamine 2-epimerase (non-hydrolyzing) [Methanomassiliicoccales archaeon]